MTTFMDKPVLNPVAADRARSWLLVPGGKPDTFTAAAESAADAIILDIEDAVAPAAKPTARRDVVEWLRAGGRAWVRVNDATTPYWADDLDALRGIDTLEGVMLAKTESGSQVDATAERLGDGCRIVALVESAMGLEASPEIARADATFRLAFGSGDFRRDTGMSDDPMAMSYPRARLVISSRAARLPGPIDGPTLTVNDTHLARDSKLTVSMGMTGKLCMHTGQGHTVNRELAPSSADVAWAHDTIATLGQDGENVRDGSDLPRLAKAKKIAAEAEVFSIS